MSKHANPALIGAFVLGAFALGVITILMLSGGQWFQERRQQILYFEGAAQGLQVGAPVVFLGVKVGTVKRIQLGLEEDSRTFLVPVTIVIEPAVVLTSRGEQIDLSDPQTMRQLIDRGLRAQLRMQSVLTGQLYVGLDFHPDKPIRYFASDGKLTEIPTIPTTVEELSLKLESFPMEKFLKDMAAISASVSKLLAADETAELPQRLSRTLDHFESLAKKLDDASAPMLRDLRTDLAALHAALAAVTSAAERVAALTDPQLPLFNNLTRAGEELAGAARGVRELSDAGAPTLERLDLVLLEISRAARALRLLAETIEQQPEALLRGKRRPEANHGH
ncbi:MAG: MlaD family protein [Desulfuromonadales bacterium]|jgi:paraquat-inducible protein B|nr:MlaD family protein [Desulfuromonadales bacterium]